MSHTAYGESQPRKCFRKKALLTGSSFLVTESLASCGNESEKKKEEGDRAKKKKRRTNYTHQAHEVFAVVAGLKWLRLQRIRVSGAVAPDLQYK